MTTTSNPSTSHHTITVAVACVAWTTNHHWTIVVLPVPGTAWNCLECLVSHDSNSGPCPKVTSALVATRWGPVPGRCPLAPPSGGHRCHPGLFSAWPHGAFNLRRLCRNCHWNKLGHDQTIEYGTIHPFIQLPINSSAFIIDSQCIEWQGLYYIIDYILCCLVLHSNTFYESLNIISTHLSNCITFFQTSQHVFIS